jgi:hypothetical protein
MSGFDLELNTKDIEGLMEHQVTRQVNFATMQTLSNVAFDVKNEVARKMPMWLKLKKKWLPSQVRVTKATFKKMQSEVGFLNSAELVELLEDGGTRKPAKSRVIAVPIGAINKSGRVTKANRPKNILARNDTFSDTINGTAGIWQKKRTRGGGRKLTLMYVYKEVTTYDSNQIKFFDTMKRVVPKAFANRFKINLKKALAQTKRTKFG